jgi:chromosome segregation ATPase
MGRNWGWNGKVVGMSVDLDELRRLEAAATKGPWVASDCSENAKCRTIHLFNPGGDLAAESHRVDDAAFIAAIRNAAPGLLDEVARLGELVAVHRHWRASVQADLATLESVADELCALKDKHARLETALAEAKRKADDHRRLYEAEQKARKSAEDANAFLNAQLQATMRDLAECQRARDEWARQCNMASEAQADALSQLANMTERYHQSTRDEEVLRDKAAHRGAYGATMKGGE